MAGLILPHIIWQNANSLPRDNPAIMSKELITTTSAVELPPAVAALIASATSDNTKRAYRSDWSDFAEYCQMQKASALPAEPLTVSTYLEFLAAGGHKVSTLKRRIVAIAAAHEASGHETPTRSMLVRKTMQGIRHTYSTEVKKKQAITIPELHAMVQSTPGDLRGLRDKAILTLHFAGAFRRSEVCDLTIDRVKFSASELRVRLGKTKTDQEGKGKTKILSASDLRAIDPVSNLRTWLDAGGITDGPLFRLIDKHGAIGQHKLSGESIAQIWKAAAKRAGLDSKEIAGHSARRGFITAAYNAELPEADIMAHTGHKSPSVMRDYREDSGVASRKVSRVVLNG